MKTRKTRASSRREFLKLSAAAMAAAPAFPMPALAQAPTVLRFASQQPVNSIYTQAMDMFAKEVNELSSGKLKVENFPNSTLGDATQMMTGIQMGTQSMGIATPAWFSRSVKQVDVFTLPYIVSSTDRLRSALDGKLGQQVSAAAESAGLKFLGTYLMGARSIVNNVRAVNVPDDVKGLKIRVIGSPVYLQMFSALGATPVAMPPSELYLALQQKVLDGFQYPLPDLLDAKLYEVSKFLSLDEHVTDFFIIGMNKGIWDRLSSEQKGIVAKAIKASADWQWTNQPANIVAAREKLKTLMSVNEVTPENKQKFVQATLPVYDKFADTIGRDLLALARKELGPA